MEPYDNTTRLVCPLNWPTEWPRHAGPRGPAPYRVEATTAFAHLADELRRWRCTAAVVSTNLRVNLRGAWYSDEKDRNPPDPGVALSFKRGDQALVIACDRWDSVRGNLRAIGLMVSGLRAIERTQVGELMRRACQGLAALPPPGGTVVAMRSVWWRDVLGIDAAAGCDEARAAYHRCARQAHPDAGGTDAMMVRVNAAWEAAAEFFKVEVAS